MKKILFLTTAHRDDDDRIFHHQAKTFYDEGYRVKVCSLSSARNGVFEGIEVESFPILERSTDEKIEAFRKVIADFQPDGIFCSEPLAVVATKDYQKKTLCPVVYDITEWYPSLRMIAGHSLLMKILLTIKLFLIQLYAGLLSTAFIFGEKTKYFPLYYLFFWKKSIVLPYYPMERYIHNGMKSLEKKQLTLAYTGIFSKGKGVGNFLEVADAIRKKRPELHLHLLLIGRSPNEEEDAFFQAELKRHSLHHVEVHSPVSLEDFSFAIRHADFCFDLREVNFENHHCLPIKIFYYAASGKPVVYSHLKAIKKQVEYKPFAILVNPENAETIAEKVLAIYDAPSRYEMMAKNARKLFEEKYNWALLKPKMLTFTQNLFQ